MGVLVINFLYFVLLFPLVIYSTIGSASSEKKGSLQPFMAPSAYFMSNPTSNEALNMKCEIVDLATITCRFTQISIQKRSDEKIEQEIAKTREEIEKWTLNDKQKIDNILETCEQRLAESRVYIENRKSALMPSKQVLDEEDLATEAKLCSCKKKRSPKERRDCFIEGSIDQKRESLKSCRVSAAEFNATFKRVGERKWLYNPGPMGLCGAVTVIELQHEPESNLLWTFKQTRVSVGQSDDEICKHIEVDKPVIYSWRYPNAAKLSCEKIDFRW